MSEQSNKWNELFINEKILNYIGDEDVVSLHNHTLISDGKETLQELVETYKKCLPNLLKNKKLIISPSDHDTIYPIHKKNLYIPLVEFIDTDLKKYSDENRVYFMLSSEIKVQHFIEEYSTKNPVLFELLITNISPSALFEGPVYDLLKKDVFESREKRNTLILAYLSKELGKKITLDDIKKYVLQEEKGIKLPVLAPILNAEIYNNAVISRNHIANYLEKYGLVKERQEAFDKYLDTKNLNAKGIPLENRPSAKKVTDAFLEIGAKIGISHLDKIRWDNTKPDPDKKALNKRHFKKMCDELNVRWIETYYPYEREHIFIKTPNSNAAKKVDEAKSSHSWDEFARKHGFVGMHGLDFHSRDTDILLLQIIDRFYNDMPEKKRKEELLPIIKNYIFKTKYYLLYDKVEDTISPEVDEFDKKKLERQEEFLNEKAEIFYRNYQNYPDFKLMSKSEKLKQLFQKKEEEEEEKEEEKEIAQEYPDLEELI